MGKTNTLADQSERRVRQNKNNGQDILDTE